MLKPLLRVGLMGAAFAMLAACSQVGESIPASMKPLSATAMHLLGKKGMSVKSPIYVRIFKEESELEVWKAREDGHFYHFKTYPICVWSGGLGPKIVEGDKQAPEGYYAVGPGQLNPNSSYYLSFNLGYPNAFDRANGRTGAALMVHGNCKSAGCYAMTDALIEEIYALAREAFSGGQEKFPAHAFPFRMTEANLARHKEDPSAPFWKTMKEGYDYFEATRQPPEVAVCGKKYVVNPQWQSPLDEIDPAAPCPKYKKVQPEPFASVLPVAAEVANVVAPGRKVRNLALEAESGSYSMFGLTKSAINPFVAGTPSQGKPSSKKRAWGLDDAFGNDR